jgi:hypothetical protein
MYHHKAGLDEPSLEDDLFEIPDRIAIKGGFWGIYGGAKPTVDVLISLLALAFLAPLMLLVFVAIKCDGGGAFYVQSRVGPALVNRRVLARPPRRGVHRTPFRGHAD